MTGSEPGPVPGAVEPARVAISSEEIAACYRAMRALRTELPEERFVDRVRAMQAEGYRLAYIEETGQVVCVAGFRIQTNFFLGRHLYVEDLSTVEARRSAGYGARMLDWLRALACTEGCAAIDLDSGVQRHLAHRFYFRSGMHVACYHFVERLAGPVGQG